MIASLSGTVLKAGLDSVVLGVGGVGMLVHTTPATAASVRVGAGADLETTLVVREDSLTLFGFVDDDEKQVFELVQTASGVGPKLAQAMLAVLTPDAVRRAVAGDDVRTLTAVPGIGQKGAQRIILELKDRIGIPVASSAGGVPTLTEPWREQVQQGLVGLGWSAKDADQAIERVADGAGAPKSATGEVDVAAALRAALSALSRA